MTAIAPTLTSAERTRLYDAEQEVTRTTAALALAQVDLAWATGKVTEAKLRIEAAHRDLCGAQRERREAAAA
jgi:hypothetical protein